MNEAHHQGLSQQARRGGVQGARAGAPFFFLFPGLGLAFFFFSLLRPFVLAVRVMEREHTCE